MQLQGRNSTWQKVCPSHCFGLSTFWSVTQIGYAAIRQASPRPARHSQAVTPRVSQPSGGQAVAPHSEPWPAQKSGFSHTSIRCVPSFIPASHPTRSCFLTHLCIHQKVSLEKYFLCSLTLPSTLKLGEIPPASLPKRYRFLHSSHNAVVCNLLCHLVKQMLSCLEVLIWKKKLIPLCSHLSPFHIRKSWYETHAASSYFQCKKQRHQTFSLSDATKRVTVMQNSWTSYSVS